MTDPEARLAAALHAHRVGCFPSWSLCRGPDDHLDDVSAVLDSISDWHLFTTDSLAAALHADGCGCGGWPTVSAIHDDSYRERAAAILKAAKEASE